MSSNIREVVQSIARPDQINRELRDNSFQKLDGIGISLPHDGTTPSPIGRPVIYLSKGTHNLPSLANNTIVQGVPGSHMTGLNITSTGVSISGLRFESKESDVLVNVGAVASVIFINCHFYRDGNLPSGNHVMVEVGGKAMFFGCTFNGAALNSVVTNLGVITDVKLYGCFNNTGNLHVNVTEV